MTTGDGPAVAARGWWLPTARPAWARVAGGAAVAVYAWWATGLTTFSTESTVAVVGGGAVAIAWGTGQRWARRRRGDGDAGASPPAGRSGLPGLGIWAGLVLVLAGWQMQAYLQSPREDHPTLSYLVNNALDSHAARTVACFAWLVGAVRLARKEPT